MAVFGLRRGGSTMAADVFRAQPGCWVMDEPYALFETRPATQRLGRRYFRERPAHSQFFDLAGERLDEFDRYTQRLLSLPPIRGSTSRPRFGFVTDHTALKVLNAAAMLDHLAERHRVEPIVVVRHPAGQALSVLRQGWRFPLEAYLARPNSWAALLGPAAIAVARRELDRGDPWRTAIVSWVFESAPLRAQFARRPGRCFFYEDLVAEPEAFVGALAEAGLIDDLAAVRRSLARPSNSSRLAARERVEAIRGGRTDELVGSWRRRITAAQAREGQALLEAFGVREYRFDSVWPYAHDRTVARHRSEAAEAAGAAGATGATEATGAPAAQASTPATPSAQTPTQTTTQMPTQPATPAPAERPAGTPGVAP